MKLMKLMKIKFKTLGSIIFLKKNNLTFVNLSVEELNKALSKNSSFEFLIDSGQVNYLFKRDVTKMQYSFVDAKSSKIFNSLNIDITTRSVINTIDYYKSSIFPQRNIIFVPNKVNSKKIFQIR